ncbi:MAG: hypothetical protein ACLT98_11335 [Eggerthellaceae bacterium]
MTRTAVNITGDAVCTMVVAKQRRRVNKAVFDVPTRARRSRRCARLLGKKPIRPALRVRAESAQRRPLSRP